MVNGYPALMSRRTLSRLPVLSGNAFNAPKKTTGCEMDALRIRPR